MARKSKRELRRELEALMHASDTERIEVESEVVEVRTRDKAESMECEDLEAVEQETSCLTALNASGQVVYKSPVVPVPQEGDLVCVRPSPTR